MNPLANWCVLLFAILALASVSAIEEVGDEPEDLVSFDAFSRIEAESYNDSMNVETLSSYSASGGYYVGNINHGDWIVFEGVDFQNEADAITMSLSAWQSEDNYGHIELRLDNNQSEPIVTITTRNTGGVESWVTINLFLDSVPKGLHDLFLTFTSNESDIAYVANIDWFQFIMYYDA